jgi:hypothetical protein
MRIGRTTCLAASCLFLGVFALATSGCLRRGAPTAPPGGQAGLTPVAAVTTTLTTAGAEAPTVSPTLASVVPGEGMAPVSSYANYTAVLAKYELELTPEQEHFLDQNRFLLVPAEEAGLTSGFTYDEMLAAYDRVGGAMAIEERKASDAVLVTPDVVLQAFHRFFEMTLEELERGELNDLLGTFLRALHTNLAAAAETADGPVAERYRTLEAQVVLALVLFEDRGPAKPDFFAAPEEETAFAEDDATADSRQGADAILDRYSSDLSPELVGAIRSELDAIYAADSMGESALFGPYCPQVSTDYTQYTPRSHYTKTSGLRAYFRTMIYLGRSSYCLKSDLGISDAVLLAGQFAVDSGTDGVPLDAWHRIMAVTGFYSGRSDDLTYDEWYPYLISLFGEDGLRQADVLSGAFVSEVADNLTQLAQPRILSDAVIYQDIGAMTKADLLRESLSYRVFGQRFTFDAWVLNDLTAGQEQTETRLPSTPSALFVPASFGDERAREHVRRFLAEDAGFAASDLPGFFVALDHKATQIADVPIDQWYADLGAAWLYVLGALTRAYGEDYPAFMRGLAFRDEQIQTFLGSYTALKHDTLLYAKQSYAELGGGPPEEKPVPPVVRGFVEPNPDFWQRFMALLDRAAALFDDNGLFVDHTARARLEEFRGTSQFLASIADRELSGEAISDEEYERLRTTRLSYMAQPFSGETPDEDSGRTAIVADIHTDALMGQILYEAIGRPYLMLAAVDDAEPRLVAGVAYDHYELTEPIGQRLTDADWRGRVYDGAEPQPVKNFWYESLATE